MILTRIGAKSSKSAAAIRQHFTPHRTYIEPFFGAGKMFFQKPLVAQNILNDRDNEVMNFWQVIKFQKDKFIKELMEMPLHEGLFNHWKNNEETDPIFRAIRFWFLCNVSYLGKMDTMHFRTNCLSKNLVTKRIDRIFGLLKNVLFQSGDFRKCLDKIVFEHRNKNGDFKNSYIYNDPPYYGTTQTYNCPKWTLSDFDDLLDMNIKSGIRFSISEYDHPEIIERAKSKDLNVLPLGERKAIKSRKNEILITNYKSVQLSIFELN